MRFSRICIAEYRQHSCGKIAKKQPSREFCVPGPWILKEVWSNYFFFRRGGEGAFLISNLFILVSLSRVLATPAK